MRSASILLAAFILAGALSSSHSVSATGLFKSDEGRLKIFKDKAPRPAVRGFRARRPATGGYQFNYQPMPSVDRDSENITWSPYVDLRPLWERVQREDTYP